MHIFGKQNPHPIKKVNGYGIKVNAENFFTNTFCIWEEANLKNFDMSNPDYTSEVSIGSSDYTPRIPSQYWYRDGGVYRIADHWGKTNSCYWILEGQEKIKIENPSEPKLGFTYFGRFRPLMIDVKNINIDQNKMYLIREFGLEPSYITGGDDYYRYGNHPLHVPEKVEVMNPGLEEYFYPFINPVRLMELINKKFYIH